MIEVAAGISRVTVRCTLSTGYVQALGAVQDNAPSGLGEVEAGDSWDVIPQMFGVARRGGTNVRFIFWASVS